MRVRISGGISQKYFAVDKVYAGLGCGQEGGNVIGINIINTFAANYLNTKGLNNSCLKSPASTLVDLTF